MRKVIYHLLLPIGLLALSGCSLLGITPDAIESIAGLEEGETGVLTVEGMYDSPFTDTNITYCRREWAGIDLTDLTVEQIQALTDC
jgi:hypothetical protein